jgi:hypothetical protein
MFQDFLPHSQAKAKNNQTGTCQEKKSPQEPKIIQRPWKPNILWLKYLA